jgi:hypothetical protein
MKVTLEPGFFLAYLSHRLANEGDIEVPMGMPTIWREFLLLKVKLFELRRTSAALTISPASWFW